MKMRIQRTAEEYPAAVFYGEGRIMKKFLLALLAFITVSCPAFAADWVYLGKIGDKIVYLDRDSITKSHGEVGGWVKFIKPGNGKLLGRLFVRESDQTFTIVAVISYDETGRVVNRYTEDNPKYEMIVPDSIIDRAYNVLVKNTGKDL